MGFGNRCRNLRSAVECCPAPCDLATRSAFAIQQEFFSVPWRTSNLQTRRDCSICTPLHWFDSVIERTALREWAHTHSHRGSCTPALAECPVRPLTFLGAFIAEEIGSLFPDDPVLPIR